MGSSIPSMFSSDAPFHGFRPLPTAPVHNLLFWRKKILSVQIVLAETRGFLGHGLQCLAMQAISVRPPSKVRFPPQSHRPSFAELESAPRW